MENDIYYNVDKVLEKNCFINFIIGGRGCGKSFAFKRLAIDRFLEKKEEFVIIRRNQTDIDELIVNSKFFDDIREYYTNEFKCKGNICYCDGEPCGYFISLNSATKHKSVPYPKVTTIIFDEFIIGRSDPRNYMKNECETFLGLLSTIIRSRDNCNVYLLGNYETIENPYFSYFKIYPQKNQRFTRKGDKLIDNYKNNKFVNMMEETRFGKLIKDTRFGDFAIKNETLDDNEDNVSQFFGRVKFQIGYKIGNLNIGVWENEDGDMWISRKIDENGDVKIINDFNTFNYYVTASVNPVIRKLRWCLDSNTIYFEDMMSKRIFIDHCKVILKG